MLSSMKTSIAPSESPAFNITRGVLVACLGKSTSFDEICAHLRVTADITEYLGPIAFAPAQPNNPHSYSQASQACQANRIDEDITRDMLAIEDKLQELSTRGWLCATQGLWRTTDKGAKWLNVRLAHRFKGKL
jgi:hypothetical protein